MGASGRGSRYAAEADSLALRCLLLLEQLLPVERAAFLLHHVLGRSRAETARAVGISEATCQEMLMRVRGVMCAAKPRIEAERKERRDVTRRFLAGVRDGDIALLADLLAPDAVAYVDATQAPTIGRRKVARLVGSTGEAGNLSLEIADGLVQTVRCHTS